MLHINEHFFACQERFSQSIETIESYLQDYQYCQILESIAKNTPSWSEKTAETPAIHEVYSHIFRSSLIHTQSTKESGFLGSKGMLSSRSKTDNQLISEVDTDALAVPNVETKRKVLCRIQKRIKAHSDKKEEQIRTFSEILSKRWNIEATTIQELLKDATICSTAELEVAEKKVLQPIKKQSSHSRFISILIPILFSLLVLNFFIFLCIVIFTVTTGKKEQSETSSTE